jgi:hypothetical protein
VELGRPSNITNREGYDNQPMFLPDGRSLFYTSIREDGQADIYRYSLADGSTARVTATKESEYSATPMPGGKFFSVIRVEPDATQRLWRFPLAGGSPTLVLEKIKPVGYHVWIDARTLGLFILGKPNTLQLVDVPTGKATLLVENGGRSLQRIPRRRGFSFVHKISEEEWLVKTFDAKTRAVKTLVRTLPGSEDFAWMPDGSLLMAKGSKLFRVNPQKETDWRELADFSADGLREITRLAVSPAGDRIALVAVRGSL